MTIIRRLSELAGALGLDHETLVALSEKAEDSYHRFPVRTKRRRVRWIEAPQPYLKFVQRRLLDRILYQATPHPAAHGFFPRRSIVTNARLHAGKAWALSLDLKDFFPSTGEIAVKKTLKKFLSLEGEALDAVLRLTCRGGALPQGAPTSPHLANLAFFSGDEALTALAARHGLSYTRYADDITLSGNQLPEDLEARVEEITNRSGYRLAKEKTKKMGRHRSQRVTGLVVNDGVKLPRSQRRKLRAIRHDLQNKGPERALARSGYGSLCELEGHLAFERMVMGDKG